jgi:hypothetical protein
MPSLGIILVKVEGCDGGTTCGNHTFDYQIDKTYKPWYKFEFIYDISRKLVSFIRKPKPPFYELPIPESFFRGFFAEFRRKNRGLNVNVSASAPTVKR